MSESEWQPAIVRPDENGCRGDIERVRQFAGTRVMVKMLPFKCLSGCGAAAVEVLDDDAKKLWPDAFEVSEHVAICVNRLYLD